MISNLILAEHRPEALSDPSVGLVEAVKQWVVGAEGDH